METGRSAEGKAITIYDIAREAGVSSATVSRVLTNSANVRPEKKEKVLKLIEKYDFRPNAMARGLADTRSKIIGIISADVRNPYYAQVFAACEIAARKRGYTVLLCNSLGEREQELKLLEKLHEQRVDAVIQLGGRVDDMISDVEYVEKVNGLSISTPVVVTGKLEGSECYQVRIDEMKAMELVMEHLILLGHREIALIGGSRSVLSTYEKLLRYKQILMKNQIPYREELVAGEGSYDIMTAYQQMNSMLEKGIIPTAVIAVNDFSAAGIMRSIQENGYRIPEDISLVSYDNTYIAEVLMPKLTSVDYNYERFGEMLVETAAGAVEGREIPRLQMMEPALIVRESSGKVPERNQLLERYTG
jgi:LacI family transcriptional regulator